MPLPERRQVRGCKYVSLHGVILPPKKQPAERGESDGVNDSGESLESYGRKYYELTSGTGCPARANGTRRYENISDGKKLQTIIENYTLHAWRFWKSGRLRVIIRAREMKDFRAFTIVIHPKII